MRISPVTNYQTQNKKATKSSNPNFNSLIGIGKGVHIPFENFLPGILLKNSSGYSMVHFRNPYNNKELFRLRIQDNMSNEVASALANAEQPGLSCDISKFVTSIEKINESDLQQEAVVKLG